jgi:predicted RNA binding protein YcfA (HicA-like mRNA interferase family)
MKVAAVLDLLKEDGWLLVRMKGAIVSSSTLRSLEP